MVGHFKKLLDWDFFLNNVEIHISIFMLLWRKHVCFYKLIKQPFLWVLGYQLAPFHKNRLHTTIYINICLLKQSVQVICTNLVHSYQSLKLNIKSYLVQPFFFPSPFCHPFCNCLDNHPLATYLKILLALLKVQKNSLILTTTYNAN